MLLTCQKLLVEGDELQKINCHGMFPSVLIIVEIFYSKLDNTQKDRCHNMCCHIYYLLRSSTLLLPPSSTFTRPAVVYLFSSCLSSGLSRSLHYNEERETSTCAPLSYPLPLQLCHPCPHPSSVLSLGTKQLSLCRTLYIWKDNAMCKDSVMRSKWHLVGRVAFWILTFQIKMNSSVYPCED